MLGLAKKGLLVLRYRLWVLQESIVVLTLLVVRVAVVLGTEAAGMRVRVGHAARRELRVCCLCQTWSNALTGAKYKMRDMVRSCKWEYK